MASVYQSVSRTELIQRRKQLRRQKLIKSLQILWRGVLVTSMGGGLIWLVTLPDWTIRQPQQVIVEGNQLLTKSAIRTLLPLAYPESILRLEPKTIAQSLEAQAPIATATVTRQLLPPVLTVQVKERKPVAMALQTIGNTRGVLDSEGVWIPLESYKSVQPDFELPKLKVIGFSPQYRPYWSRIYQAIIQSPVKVIEVDCRDPLNLRLNTELGKVHLGDYSSDISDRLSVLDRMRDVSSKINTSKIAYIDLRNVDSPSIHLKQ